MEGNEESRVEEFKGDMREPYMGNTVPVKVRLIYKGDELSKVVLVNPEGIRTLMEPTRRFIMKQLGEDENGSTET